MQIEEFIQNFADQFDDLDGVELTGATKFKELEEWTSLIALSVIAMVDDEYDVILKGDDIKGVSTIEELFNIVQSKID